MAKVPDVRSTTQYGGLDPYILNTRHELLGPEGMRIRLLLRQRQEELAKEEARAKRRLERQTLQSSDIAKPKSAPQRRTAVS